VLVEPHHHEVGLAAFQQDPIVALGDHPHVAPPVRRLVGRGEPFLDLPGLDREQLVAGASAEGLVLLQRVAGGGRRVHHILVVDGGDLLGELANLVVEGRLGDGLTIH
jgi:hypothetical protein